MEESFPALVERIRTFHKEFAKQKFPYMGSLTELVDAHNLVLRDPAIAQLLRNPTYVQGYCAFKAAVVAALAIKTVCETGIGLGISATSFVEGNPDIKYTGIDNLENDVVWGYPMSGFVASALNRRNVVPTFIIQDTREMKKLPGQYDLVHIDANHFREGCKHEVEMAWDSKSEYILVDDTHYTAVMAGTMDALFDKDRYSIQDWTHFPETWSGNILIRRRNL